MELENKWSWGDSNPCPKILLNKHLTTLISHLCSTSFPVPNFLATQTVLHLLFLWESGIQHDMELFEPQIAYPSDYLFGDVRITTLPSLNDYYLRLYLIGY